MTTNLPGKPAQLGEADVKRLHRERKYEQINQAREAGRLDDLMGVVRHWPPKSGQWTAGDLAAMTAERRHAEIAAARTAGQLDDLFTGVDPDAA